MQHIGIELQDEHGEALETSSVNFADIMSMVYQDEDFKNKYPFLSTVDPYGNTTFSILQIPHLTKELTSLSSGQGDLVGEAISFLNKIDTHQYIKFIGD